MDNFNIRTLYEFAQTHNTGGGIWGLDPNDEDSEAFMLSEILDFSRVWVVHSTAIDNNTIELELGIYEFNSNDWRRLNIRCKIASNYPKVILALNRDYNYTLDIYLPSAGSPFDDYWGAVLMTVGKSPKQVHCYIECSDIEIREYNDPFSSNINF